MDFVNVVSAIPDLAIYRDTAILSKRLTEKVLVSLIKGYAPEYFGFDTMKNMAFEVRAIKKGYANELYLDSGGYSIINGSIHPKNIPMVIECYNKFLELEHSPVDQFFSLDIPSIIKGEYASFNTKSNIFDCNRMSLMESRALLEDPDIRRKFCFIWQFKTLEHYEIWARLYDELELGKTIMRRAVGGLVGLNAMAKIRFAPFICMAYRCLWDHQEGDFPEEPFFLHCLGVKSPADRLILTLIEELFKRYLDGITYPVITYDSAAPTRQIEFQTKTHKTYTFENGSLTHYKSLFDLPKDLIEKIYLKDFLAETMSQEIESLRAGKRMANVCILHPLAIYTELSINNYFAHLIHSHEMVDILMQRTSIIQVKSDLRPILNALSLEQPQLFTKKFIEDFNMNVAKVFRFHQWYRNKRDRASLEELMRDFIGDINFPEKLK